MALVIAICEPIQVLFISLQDSLNIAPSRHLGALEQSWRVLRSTFGLVSNVAAQYGDEVVNFVDVISGACLCGSGWNWRATTVSTCALAGIHGCIEIMCMCMYVVVCACIVNAWSFCHAALACAVFHLRFVCDE